MGQSDGKKEHEVVQEVQGLQQHHHDGSFLQHVVVMRHGDRIDNFEPLWDIKASRPWDPPLTQDGKDRAFSRGRKFRSHFRFPIHRVFVSPFLRCLQTAEEVIRGLFAVNDHDPTVTSSAGVTIDPSKVKVSVECGLCEMMNEIAIRPKVAPEDLEFGFVISECEALLPAGTVDHNVKQLEEIPRWGESSLDARTRYARIVKTLADKYPSENLLLVTHGEGVGSSVAAFSKLNVSSVDYCGYSHMSRHVSVAENQSFTAKEFEVHVMGGENGLSYFQPSDT